MKYNEKPPFILIHGGWAGGWQWRTVVEELVVRGYSAIAPTLTGLGERVHLASPDIDINTYIKDIEHVFEYENLWDVILVGFSFSGMVATGVAEVIPERIRHIVYLDAFVPKDGQSLADIIGERIARHFFRFAEDYGEGWKVPSFFHNDSRLTPQPLQTSTLPVSVTNPRSRTIPRTYIKCTAKDPQWSFTPVLNRVADYARSMGWGYRELSSDHFPMDNAKEELLQVLVEIAGGGGDRRGECI